MSHQTRMISKAAVANVNYYRRKEGLRPLKYSRVLTISSNAYAKYLYRTKTFQHDDHIHVRKRFRWLGEVLAMGQPALIIAIRDWLNSDGHRAILLSTKARRMGLGKAGDIRVGHFGRV